MRDGRVGSAGSTSATAALAGPSCARDKDMLVIARRLVCIAVFASACASPTADAPASWSTVFADLDRVALSVWSDRPDDVFIVGGGLDVPGVNALALHWDGSRWRDLAPAGEQTLWWVTGVPDRPDEVWMVGESGT